MLKLVGLIVCLLFLVFAPITNAQSQSSFVTVINPVRGNDFWELGDQEPSDAIVGQMQILQELNLLPTWLIRFDALQDAEIVKTLKSVPDHEKGLFLEVTPTFTTQAGVAYNRSENWHSPGSVLLTGYSQNDRLKLIDEAFESFDKKFGYFPKSVGAWWIDSFSLDYMQKRYGINSVLIVADQYSTDDYQVWGQYFSTPYYPNNKNALIPAQNVESKIPLVVMQWAARDPLHGYGRWVNDSTFSVQPNDYMDYHNLDINYFNSLVDIYTKQNFNKFGHIVVGLENTYSWEIYGDEYRRQMVSLAQKRQSGQFLVVPMKDFSIWYQTTFPHLSPEHIIVADDPLGSGKKVVWFMNSYYRAGLFYNEKGLIFRNIRQYVDGQEEVCYQNACNKLNFATFATRVLDDVTYDTRWIVEKGKIKQLKVEKDREKYIVSYLNESNFEKNIELLPRDIVVEGEVRSIDAAILYALSLKHDDLGDANTSADNLYPGLTKIISNLVIDAIKFILFLTFFAVLPGYMLVKRLAIQSFGTTVFLSTCLGLVFVTLFSYFLGYLNIKYALFFLPLLSLTYAWKANLYQEFKQTIFKKTKLYKDKLNLIRRRTLFILLILIISGTFFQTVGMARSGFYYDFGIGYFGPTGHDGVWHQSLVNQLVNQVPPINPGFSGEVLSNYHYFYNLLVATTYSLSQIPVLDLIYRFYPIIFSLLLGFGTYILANKLFKNEIASLLSVYFVYFAGSFGWIVEFLREGHFGGESAFWANQPVSMNLNPPFAISLSLFIAVIITVQVFTTNKGFFAGLVLIILAGSLIEFKVYAGVVVLLGLLMLTLQKFLEKDLSILPVFIFSLLLSLLVFLPQNSKSGELLIFAPFWFVHSMVDFPDRVGWLKLSQARMAYFARGEWLKYSLTEFLALTMFVLGNIGTRLFGLFTFVPFIKNKLWNDPLYVFLFWLGFFSLTIPLFFVQKGNPWNTIQFLYYFLYVTALLTGIVLLKMYKFLPKPLGIVFLTAILLLTPINAITTFRSGFYKLPPSKVTYGELEGLLHLKSLPDGVVLTYPFIKNLRVKYAEPYPLFVYETTAYVSAFSTHPTYIEDEMQQEILQNNYQERIDTVNKFLRENNWEWSRKFLRENEIKYIYLPKEFRVNLNKEELGLNHIFENAEVDIYEVI